MLIHLGTEDLRVPNSQGMSLYHMLKARNVETKLVYLYCIIFALISCTSCYHHASVAPLSHMHQGEGIGQILIFLHNNIICILTLEQLVEQLFGNVVKCTVYNVMYT